MQAVELKLSFAGFFFLLFIVFLFCFFHWLSQFSVLVEKRKEDNLARVKFFLFWLFSSLVNDSPASSLL